MFENIGEKIKSLATILTWIGVIGFGVCGIALLMNGEVVAGILTTVIGALGSWVSAFTLYGFGELIEVSVAINDKLGKINEEALNSGKKVKSASQGTMLWICSKCGREQLANRKVCWECGNPKPEEENAESREVANTDNSPKEMWICSKCGKRQAAYRKVCWGCGATRPNE